MSGCGAVFISGLSIQTKQQDAFVSWAGPYGFRYPHGHTDILKLIQYEARHPDIIGTRY